MSVKIVEYNIRRNYVLWSCILIRRDLHLRLHRKLSLTLLCVEFGILQFPSTKCCCLLWLVYITTRDWSKYAEYIYLKFREKLDNMESSHWIPGIIVLVLLLFIYLFIYLEHQQITHK